MASLTYLDIFSTWKTVALKKKTTTVGFSSEYDITVRAVPNVVLPYQHILNINRHSDGSFSVSWPFVIAATGKAKLVLRQHDATPFGDIGYRLKDGDAFVFTCGDECGPFWFSFQYPASVKKINMPPAVEVQEELEKEGGKKVAIKGPRPIPYLPAEIWCKIFRHVHPVDLLHTIAPVCTRFFEIVQGGLGGDVLKLDEEFVPNYTCVVGQKMSPLACLSMAVVCGPDITKLEFDCRCVPSFQTLEATLDGLKGQLRDLKIQYMLSTPWNLIGRPLESLFRAGKLKSLELPMRLRSVQELARTRCPSVNKLTILCAPREEDEWKSSLIRKRLRATFSRVPRVKVEPTRSGNKRRPDDFWEFEDQEYYKQLMPPFKICGYEYKTKVKPIFIW